MRKPSRSRARVPATPCTDEAVPAIGARCSIASVPRFDEVKARRAHGQRRQDDEDGQRLSKPGQCNRRVKRSDNHEGERRTMSHAAKPEAADDLGVEVRGERHRRRDRGEHQANKAPFVEDVENDLLDRRNISDQRGEADCDRQRRAERLAVA